MDRFDTSAEQQSDEPHAAPSFAMVRATLIATMAVLGVAALVHVLRYLLLLINRTVLLPPLVAAAATWLGVLASVLAMFMVAASAVVLTNWLIARRAAAYRRHGQQDPRRPWMLRAGCLIPVVNLVWAPVFVIELARLEERFTRLRQTITVWGIVWVASTAVSVFSLATSFTRDPQGIADNTVTATIAYLLGLAALLMATQVFLGFERVPVERRRKRWVIAGDQPSSGTGALVSDEPVESDNQSSAA